MPHYLACELHSWCTDGHVNGYGFLMALGTIAGGIITLTLIAVIAHLLTRAENKPVSEDPPLSSRESRSAS